MPTRRSDNYHAAATKFTHMAPWALPCLMPAYPHPLMAHGHIPQPCHAPMSQNAPDSPCHIRPGHSTHPHPVDRLCSSQFPPGCPQASPILAILCTTVTTADPCVPWCTTTCPGALQRALVHYNMPWCTTTRPDLLTALCNPAAHHYVSGTLHARPFGLPLPQ